MRTRARLVVVAVAGLAAAACGSTTALRRDGAAPPPGPARLILIPPDVELSELTAGGALEPKAEWTDAARAHVGAALKDVLAARNVRTAVYEPPAGDDARAHGYQQLLKLHDVVGGAVLVHNYQPAFRLPNKNGKFDWTLGDAVAVLREVDADYALFVLFRDSYASSGRVALIVGAAILGVGVPGGRQVGVASLVDLRTGDVVWFNRLLDPAGDLRTPEPAMKAVRTLLADLPL